MHLNRTLRFSSPRLTQTLFVASALLASLGCSLHRANRAFSEGRYEEATREYQKILRREPDNLQAKNGYRRSAPLAATDHIEKAKVFYSRGQIDETRVELKRALLLDTNSSIAIDWLTQLELDAQRKKAKEEAEDINDVKAKADAKNPMQLNPRTMEGIGLTFTKKTSLKEIFGILSKASGVNIIPHSSFQDMQVQIDLQGLTFQRALDTLMLQNELFYKVLDSNTIMIFKSTPQNRESYENQLIKTFYLSNAEVDGVRQVLTTLIPQLKIFTDKRLNAVTVKAKPNELIIASHIVSQLDKAKPEVMVYLELLEVTESSAEQVGLLPVISPTDGLGGGSGIFRLGATIDNTGGLNQNKGALRISKSDLRFLFPSIALDVLKSSGDARLVASPNVRVLSGEKGEVNIGDKISVTQSALSLPGGVGGSGGASGGLGGLLGGGAQTQFNYEDVGVKISVEPRVHYNGDITMKIEAAVTTLKAGSTPGRPDLGKREIKTLARLRDGETAVFGGLLKEEEQKSLQGIWGISDIPVLGKLLGNTRKNKAKTDVLLTIRTVLVRRPYYTEEDLAAFDPDRATSQEGPFTPKPESTTEDMKEPKAPKTTAAATATAPPSVITPSAASGKPAVSPEMKPDPKTDTKADTKADAKGLEAKPSDDNADLVFFMAPFSEQLNKGEKIRITLNASGAKGLTSGTLNLRVDPKLKVVSISPGDFITADAGTIQQAAGKDGAVTVTFNKPGASVDSGALIVLELEAVAPGNAPVVIQSGSFLVGKNPIPGRWVNALVTVN